MKGSTDPENSLVNRGADESVLSPSAKNKIEDNIATAGIQSRGGSSQSMRAKYALQEEIEANHRDSISGWKDLAKNRAKLDANSTVKVNIVPKSSLSKTNLTIQASNENSTYRIDPQYTGLNKSLYNKTLGQTKFGIKQQNFGITSRTGVKIAGSSFRMDQKGIVVPVKEDGVTSADFNEYDEENDDVIT